MDQYPHLTPQEALAALTPEEGRRYVGIEWLAGCCRALLAPTNPYYPNPICAVPAEAPNAEAFYARGGTPEWERPTPAWLRRLYERKSRG